MSAKLCAGCGLGFAIELVFRNLFSSEVKEGSTMSSWYVSLLYQAVLFPGICFMMMADKGFSGMFETAHCSWDNAGDEACGSMMYEEMFLHVLIGYFVRDMVNLVSDVKTNFNYIIHHIVCGLSSVMMLHFAKNGGVTAFCWGITELELGSLVLGRCFVNPESLNMVYLYLYGMTISNFIATIVLPYTLYATSETGPMQHFLVLTAICLCIGRQQICMADTARRLENFRKNRVEKEC